MFDKNLLSNNISEIDKNLLAQTIRKIDLFFAKFGVNIDYDNSKELFERLKVEEVKGEQNYVRESNRNCSRRTWSRSW